MKLQIRQEIVREIARSARAVIDLAAPPTCPLRGEAVSDIATLSAVAWRDMHFIEAPCCGSCGVPFAADYGADILCPSCIAAPPAFDQARAAIAYDDASHKLIVRFKHGDRTEYAPMFARWMVRAGRALLLPDSIVTPVPLHPRRLFARRFNQSGLLAREIVCRGGGRLAPDLLQRWRETPAQKNLSAKARAKNVAGAFRVAKRWRNVIIDADIVLIDDVLTTGATLSACARTLKRAGARSVSALALSRVVKGGGGAI